MQKDDGGGCGGRVEGLKEEGLGWRVGCHAGFAIWTDEVCSFRIEVLMSKWCSSSSRRREREVANRAGSRL